jgi:hypothetical protein
MVGRASPLLVLPQNAWEGKLIVEKSFYLSNYSASDVYLRRPFLLPADRLTPAKVVKVLIIAR